MYEDNIGRFLKWGGREDKGISGRTPLPFVRVDHIL